MTYLEQRQAIPINAPDFYQKLEAAWVDYATYAKARVAELDSARASKNYLLADDIRRELVAEGVTVMTSSTKTDYFI